MTLTIGTRIGPYEVKSVLGEGGMGIVYRARDTKLSRDVALKVLPDHFADDPHRLARFQREAQLLASLNHPNIAHIYGLEDWAGTRCIVMELVEGETLHRRLTRGAIQVEEALDIAKQIAGALEAADERDIIHRDLKPANIMLTGDGQVKVLDFSLAKTFQGQQLSSLSNSPTLAGTASLPGLILGTVAYMSPEQARGKAVDKRADIWAFGCVLYEMLTGIPAFVGETTADILAAVTTKEPELRRVPINVRRLVQSCLQKDPKRRLQAIGDWQLLVEDAAVDEPQSSWSPLRSWLSVAVIAILTIALAVTGIGLWRATRPVEHLKPIHFLVSLPVQWTLDQGPGPLVVSPDGNRLVFVADNGSKRLLWVHSLDALDAQPLPETEGAALPFWSPDSRFVGFFVNGNLKTIDIQGGHPATLCAARGFGGGAWSPDGIIVFSGSSVLYKVSASGGIPAAATVLGLGERAHVDPIFLPDGRHFLYQALQGSAEAPVFLASLDSSDRRILLKVDATNTRYSEGHLLFPREGTLMAQRLDLQHLTVSGEPFPIAENIHMLIIATTYGVFGASDNGVLAYQTASRLLSSRLILVDRAGKQIRALGDAADFNSDLVVSSDGKRAAVSILDQPGKGRDIWVYDIERGGRTRLTFDTADDMWPDCSPDGSQFAFASRRKGHLDLYQKASNGAGGEQLLFQDEFDKVPVSWSPDGQFLLYGRENHLYVLPLLKDRKPVPLTNTPFNEFTGRFSPDGRWVAYSSNESGRVEIHVISFVDHSTRFQISTAGGRSPRWSHDGTQLFFLAPDNQLMAATVSGNDRTLQVGSIKSVFPKEGAPQNSA